MISECWLIFRNGDHKLGPILKDGFGHVSLIYQGDEKWIFITPRYNIMKVVELPYANEKNAPKWLSDKKEYTVLKVTYNNEVKPCIFPRFMTGFTCVSFVKYFLGYKDYSITPYRFYKNLLKLKKNIIDVEELK